MADSVEQLYKAQDLQEKLYPITKENAVKDNSNVSLDTKLTSINTSISNKVDKVTGKGLSTNDYTSVEKTKLAGIEDGAQVNIIESIELNGESQPIENKTAKIDIDYESKVAGSAYSLMSDSSEDYSFNYKQVPSGTADGSAKMNSIKGNTLVWNQLVGTNVNGLSTIQGTTFSLNSNGSIHVTGTGTGNHFCEWRTYENPDFILIKGHKYLVKFKGLTTGITAQVSVSAGQTIYLVNKVNFVGDYDEIFTPTQDGITGSLVRFYATNTFSGTTDITMQLFDITQMGLDISNPSEFTSLFSKPYYDYCKGAMLSFGGRNVKFNQLVQNGNFTSSSRWASVASATINSVSNNTINVTTSATAQSGITNPNITMVQNHKYLLVGTVKTTGQTYISISGVGSILFNTNSFVAKSNIFTWTSASGSWSCMIRNWDANSATFEARNVMLIDLTEMFGAGNEPSAEGFKQLFPNDYYEYTTGKYMNIGQPVSLKTTGENLIDFSTLQIGKNWWKGSAVDRAIIEFPVEENKEYTISFDYSSNILNTTLVYRTGWNSSQISNIGIGTAKEYTFTAPSTCRVVCVQFNARTSGFVLSQSDFFGNWLCALSSTFSAFPIPLDEFPDGMDGINDVKDEKNETGYVKRFATIKVDTVAIGSPRNNGDYYAAVNGVTNAKPADNGTVANMICNICETMSAGARYNSTKNAVCARTTGSIELCISGITSRADLQTYVDSHDIYITYELATPLENYGVVDLGTYDWTYQSNYQRFLASNVLRNDAKLPANNSTRANILCSLYATATGNDTADANHNKTIGLTMTGSLTIRDESYGNDATAFKQAMSGVYLLYEKETPAEVKSDLSYKVFENGTEQLLPINSSVPVTTPLNTNITYPYVPENVLEAVKINNTALPITDKAVNITIDSEVSETSTNAVQNKTIKSYVDTAKEEVKEDISNSVLENLTSGSSLKLYAQETLADQEFLYRESPTEEDGLAKITDIKGNTLVWNQLVQNGNFADTSKWSYSGQYVSSFTVSNNEAKIVANANYAQINQSNFSVIAGHKYFCSLTAKCSNGRRIGMVVAGAGMNFDYEDMTSNYAVINKIKTAVSDSTNYLTVAVNGSQIGDEIYVKNIMIHDLTLMGIDNLTTTAEVEAWLSSHIGDLPYLDYTQGTLIPFMGTGLKTTGKNLLEPPTSGSVNGVTFTVNNDGSITVNGTATSNGTYDFYRNTSVLPSWAKLGQTYTLSLTNAINRFDIFSYDSSGTSRSLASVSAIASQMFTIPNDAVGLLIRMFVSSGITYDVTVYPQIEIGTSATSYEPYTSSTLSLPISTYFPSGMKSAGSVYDELTPTKGITRIGAVDLGSLTWAYNTSAYPQWPYFVARIDSRKEGWNNIVCSKYPLTSDIYSRTEDKVITGIAYSYLKNIIIRDSSYTNATVFKQAMQGVYLYYELATPTETSFTTEDDYPFFKSYKAGTEQILPENSSTPTTAPIIADIEYSYDFKAVDRIIGMLNSVAQNETSPSTHNYSVGDYLVYKYQLYKVIASISTGSSLTVGTNIQATTIMNELASLS